MIFSYR